MSSTVHAATFRASGSPTIPAQPATAEPVAPTTPRTFTYPLRTGGSLTEACPDWCVRDHQKHDIERFGIHPTDLVHEGAPIALSIPGCDGDNRELLDAQMQLYPFLNHRGADAPNVVLNPIAGDGPTKKEHLTAHDLGEIIATIRAHADALEQMQDRLAQAQADEHARLVARYQTVYAASAAKSPWQSLRKGDVRSMPIGYVLDVFGARVVEVDGSSRLAGGPGDMTVELDRTLPQSERENVVRALLVTLVKP